MPGWIIDWRKKANSIYSRLIRIRKSPQVKTSPTQPPIAAYLTISYSKKSSAWDWIIKLPPKALRRHWSNKSLRPGSWNLSILHRDKLKFSGPLFLQVDWLCFLINRFHRNSLMKYLLPDKVRVTSFGSHYFCRMWFVTKQSHCRLFRKLSAIRLRPASR